MGGVCSCSGLLLFRFQFYTCPEGALVPPQESALGPLSAVGMVSVTPGIRDDSAQKREHQEPP